MFATRTVETRVGHLIMPRNQDPLDSQPGSLPEIRQENDDVTYIVEPVGTPRGYKIVIRCEPNGEIWMSICTERRRAAA